MQITTIGLDIAKNVFQVHGIDGDEKVVVRKQLRRNQVIAIFPRPTAVSCWPGSLCHFTLLGARTRQARHEVRLMPAKDVKAYVKRNKKMLPTPQRSVRRFGVRPCALSSQVSRSAGPSDATSCPRSVDAPADQLINAMRSHLAELGIIAPQGREGVKELLAIIANEADTQLPNDARASLIVLAAQLQALQTTIGAIEKRIVVQHRANKESKRTSDCSGDRGYWRICDCRHGDQIPKSSDPGATLRLGLVWCRDKCRPGESRS